MSVIRTPKGEALRIARMFAAEQQEPAYVWSMDIQGAPSWQVWMLEPKGKPYIRVNPDGSSITERCGMTGRDWVKQHRGDTIYVFWLHREHPEVYQGIQYEKPVSENGTNGGFVYRFRSRST